MQHMPFINKPHIHIYYIYIYMYNCIYVYMQIYYIIHILPTKRVLAPATKAHTLAYIAPRGPETSVGLTWPGNGTLASGKRTSSED